MHTMLEEKWNPQKIGREGHKKKKQEDVRVGGVQKRWSRNKKKETKKCKNKEYFCL